MRVAFLSLPYQAISIPMTALARKYQAPGHAAVLRSLPDVAPFVQAAQMPFCPPFGGRHASSKRGSLERIDLQDRGSRDGRRTH